MWCLPTYRRPSQCANVIKGIIDVGCSTPGIVVVNGRDDEAAYRAIKLPDNWKIVILPENIGVCAAMNWVFHHYPNEPFYGLICDDEYIFTKDWDKILVAAAGKKYIAHANDGWQSGKRQHLYVTFGGDLIREIGWWSLPGLWHWFHDDVFENLSAGLNNTKFCENVKGEHRHYLAGKTPKDATYTSGESRAALDRMVYQHWMLNQYPHLKRKLINFYTEGS